VTQYYKNITSPIGANARIQERYKQEPYKGRLRVTEEKLEDKQGAPERIGL